MDLSDTSGLPRRALLKYSATGLAGIAVPLPSASAAAASGPGAATDIVDAQVHIGPDGIAPTLAMMNALGIASALIYEHWGPSPDRDPRHNLPGYAMPNGAWRGVSATATTAALLHPDRFASVVKVDPRDPQLAAVLETIASTPYIRAIRVLPVWTKADAALFVQASCDRLFGLAQDLRIPVFLFIPGHVDALAPYLRRHPRLTAIIDHCGMPFANIPLDGGPGAPAAPDYFKRVLEIAEFDNVALKWSHANDQFGVSNAPAEALRAHLRAAIEAFGVERIVWASDTTVIPSRTWSGLLSDVAEKSDLSPTEREWILGRALRRLIGWTSPPGT